jgi:hypothetical protein
VVVLGMFRSGTSCVSDCFTRLGYSFGSPDVFVGTGPSNPGGYFEIKELLFFNRQLLNFADMRYFRISEIPEDWESLPTASELTAELSSLLVKLFGGKGRWGWKEPQTSVLLPIYKKVLEAKGCDPFYAICVRNPVDAANSHLKHLGSKFTLEEAIGLWIHFTLSSLRETKGAKRIVFPYESFLQDPAKFLAAATDRLDAPSPDPAQIAEAAQAVRPDWRHEEAPDDLSRWPAIVSRAYSVAMRCAASPESLSEGAFDSEIEDLWLEWRQIRGIAQVATRPAGRFIASWSAGGRRSIEEAYTPSLGWQTAKLPIDAEPGSTISLDPFQSPCIVWIRRAEFAANEGFETAKLVSGRGGVINDLGKLRQVFVWGPEPLVLTLPSSRRIQSIEIEFILRTDESALAELISVMRAVQAQSGAGR